MILSKLYEMKIFLYIKYKYFHIIQIYKEEDGKGVS